MKQNEITCNVIADLLPLYKEGICSDDSLALVESHLEVCDECRRLAGDIELPPADETSRPDEIETFRKIGRKLRFNRFTKAMAAVFCVMLVVFGIWNGAWLAMKYLPYRRLAEGMDKPKFGKGSGREYSDGEYSYCVKFPGYLSFEGGFLRVEPVEEHEQEWTDNGGSVHDHSCTLFIWNAGESRRETEYGIFIDIPIDGGIREENYQLMVDSSLNYIPFENDRPEDIAEYEEMIENYRPELEAMMKAAQEKWGKYL